MESNFARLLLATVIILLLAMNSSQPALAAKQHPTPASKVEISNEIPETKVSWFKTVAGDKKYGSVKQATDPYKALHEQLVDETRRQQAVERDHYMMEKWLVDNINDLHRELKQTETDFEHYAQVTKNIIARNELQLKQQLASVMTAAWPLPYAVPTLQHLNQASRQVSPIPLLRPMFVPAPVHRWI